MEVFNLKFKVAFDKESNLEFFVYNHLYYDPKKQIFFSTYMTNELIGPSGSFLIEFLNTNFENNAERNSFVFWYCYENLYYRKYPEIKEKNSNNSRKLKLTASEFFTGLNEISKENKEEFLYLKQTLLKNLRLPYDNNIFMKCYHEAGFSKEDIQNSIQEDKEYFENKTIRYNDIEINGFIENIKINFETFDLMFNNIDASKYNIPYYFSGNELLEIIVLMFKEFMSNNHNTIRQCQNCGNYFIPTSLKETKYCNIKFKDTGKTCRQIGKELAYKKSLKEDKVLDKYRRRYMSLASSVSHYGTDNAIARFEKYKKEGATMKKKYLNKEISAKEFEKWILDSKKGKNFL